MLASGSDAASSNWTPGSNTPVPVADSPVNRGREEVGVPGILFNDVEKAGEGTRLTDGDDVPEEKKTSWQGASWVLLSDVVGTSVLTFSGVSRDLGWVLSILFIAVMCPLGVYTACLMSRAHKALAQEAPDGRGPSTMAQCAAMLCTGKSAKVRSAALLYFIVYGTALLGQGSYLLTLARALQGVFYDRHLCLWQAALISAACSVPFVTTLRRLSDSTAVCFFNLLLILVVVGLSIGKLAYDGRGDDIQTHAVAPGLTFLSIWGAAGNVAYSYAGHWMYFEIMDEMKKPTDFPKVFLINAPLQVCLYLLVAICGYYYGGDTAKGNVVENVPPGGLYRAVQVLLFLHVMVAFVIKTTVIGRFFLGLALPGQVEARTWCAGGCFAALAFAQLAFGYVVANAVPFFSDLLGLIGSLFSAPIAFLIPCVLYIIALLRAGDKPPTAHIPVIAFVSVLALLIMIVGTWNEIKDIVKKDGQYGLPFDCHGWNQDSS